MTPIPDQPVDQAAEALNGPTRSLALCINTSQGKNPTRVLIETWRCGILQPARASC